MDCGSFRVPLAMVPFRSGVSSSRPTREPFDGFQWSVGPPLLVHTSLCLDPGLVKRREQFERNHRDEPTHSVRATRVIPAYPFCTVLDYILLCKFGCTTPPPIRPAIRYFDFSTTPERRDYTSVDTRPSSS